MIIPTSISSIKAFSTNALIGTGIPFLIAFFTPITAMLLGVSFFTLVDTFTGMWAAKKRGEKIHSRAMGRTVTKMLFYSLAIILAHGLEVIFMPWLAVTSVVAGYIALVEFRSNMENIGYITGIDIWNYLLNKFDAFKPKQIPKNDRE